MTVRDEPVEIFHGDELLARGVCHLLSRQGPAGGTVSRLSWLGAEHDLTGQTLELRLRSGQLLPARITRHSHPEGAGVLRFTVLS